MLGHVVHGVLSDAKNFDVYGTVRHGNDNYNIVEFSLNDYDLVKIDQMLDLVRPDWIINCLGYIRPQNDFEGFKKAILLNSWFPRVVSVACAHRNIKMLHISTDCVFNGERGNYLSSDVPNEYSIYGVSKFLGEVIENGHITLRTSIIGRELETKRNLLDWFLSQSNDVVGYKNVYWNGITTLVLAKIIKKIIEDGLLEAGGLYQLSSERISKYELLMMAKDVFGKNIEIIIDDSVKSDKTIISSYEQVLFEGLIPPLKQQLIDLKNFESTYSW